MISRKRHALITFCSLVLAFCAHGQALKSSSGTDALRPFWSDLRPGAYTVGFRTLYRYDHSRSWKSTRNYRGDFSPDLNGRPIQINIWYPATHVLSDHQLTFADYVNQSAPEEFVTLNDEMKQRNRDDALGSIPQSALPTLLGTEMRSYRDAQPLSGHWPVVLYFSGLSGQINSNVVMAEYLAGRGYVFVSISLIGPSEEEMFQSRTSTDLEASVRDMEFAWALMQDEPFVDRGKVAVMGHSVGAVEAVILGMRNANVASVISLDGTYGFAGLTSVLTDSYAYSPESMRASFLDLRRSQGAQGNQPLDLSPVESFRHAKRTYVTMDQMHHSDFTSFAMSGSYFHSPLPTGYPLNGWNREAGSAGYKIVCQLVLLDLDMALEVDDAARARFEAETQKTSRIHIRQEDAVPSPPSPPEAVELAKSKGIDHVRAAFVATCGEAALASCMNVDRFNALGYALLGNRTQDALTIFLLNAWAHPQRANLQDSLADGYAAIGDKQHAREAIEQAIALTVLDSTLDLKGKASFVVEEKAKLQQLK